MKRQRKYDDLLEDAPSVIGYNVIQQMVVWTSQEKIPLHEGVTKESGRDERKARH